MIKSFADKKTEAFWNGERVRQFHAVKRTAYRRLDFLNEATRLEDLQRVPGHRFEALSGKRKGQYSIRINDQWRVCFGWQKDSTSQTKGTPGDPILVEIVDYH
ncbi:MAG: type II toxin-antitoxin system RelE/ParE family toxin [Rhodospirillales bacterium]|jgi:toxin HigB-1|nr:type II toxin-antitoxin system RelE/ParE family toxin [Rhodospirillales bacterium]